jgi:hypothetical protein
MVNGEIALYGIFGIACAYSLFATYIQNRFGEREKNMKIQAEFKELNKQIEEAVKAKDKKRIDELSEKQNKMMPQVMGASFTQLKPLIIILPVLMIVPPVLMGVFDKFTIDLPFKLPVFITNLLNFELLFGDFNTWLNWRSHFGPIGWFWISVLISALLVGLFNKAREELKKRGVMTSSSQGGQHALGGVIDAGSKKQV